MTRIWLTIVIFHLLFYTRTASAQIAKRFDLLITEVFADPSPAVALPPYEFIEVRNVSSSPFDLKDWRFGDGNSFSTITTGFVLQPDSMVIICTNSATLSYAVFGRTIGVSNFPSLDNEGDLIFLRSKEGTVIHTVNYHKSWYRNDLKSNGGWSLEMIDKKNPCGGGTNWSTSVSTMGGTPGKKNSVEGNNEDLVAPVLLRAYSSDSITLVAVFNEPIDSLSACVVTKYMFDKNNINPMQAIPVTPLFKEVMLIFRNEMNNGTVYQLTVSDIQDCMGNRVGKQHTKAGLASDPDQFDIIINEILFNPKADGSDYIELYNKSNKIIDLHNLYCANKNATGVLSNIVRLSEIPCFIFPGQFAVFTESVSWLKQSYLVKNESDVFELPSLPTMPDDKGTLAIMNMQGIIIEELQYDSKWHFALIENNEGIALERIDYIMATNNKDNWTSAASTAGYGTPAYQNSQFKADMMTQGSITTDLKTFSPDNDGFNDLVTISYQMTAPGFVANMTVFDANGRPVRYLVKNSTLGLQGSFRWDGLDEDSQQVPVGIYIVFTEIFSLQGKTKKFKNVVTLARRI